MDRRSFLALIGGVGLETRHDEPNAVPHRRSELLDELAGVDLIAVAQKTLDARERVGLRLKCVRYTPEPHVLRRIDLPEDMVGGGLYFRGEARLRPRITVPTQLKLHVRVLPRGLVRLYRQVVIQPSGRLAGSQVVVVADPEALSATAP